MKKVYQTDDGQVFETSDEATVWERQLLGVWLTNTKFGQFCAEVIDTMDNTNNDEWYGTDRDMGVEFIRAAWEFAKNASPQSPYNDCGYDDCCVRSEN